MTELRNLVKEFGERTLSNLDFVHQHSDQPGVYEVTQLWNSLSGLLVLPYELEMDAIQGTLPAAVALGWPALNETFPSGASQPDNALLVDQVRRLRNGVSHFNVEFLSRRGSIVGVKVWNHQLPPRGSGLRQRDMPITWEVEISLEQLNQLARATAALFANNFRLAA